MTVLWWSQQAKNYKEGHTMKDVQNFAAKSKPRRGDRVQGWFGTAVITDISYGWVEDHSGNQISESEDLIRIEAGGKSTFIHPDDIERNLTAENSILRS